VDQVQAAVIDVNLAAATQSINASYQPALQAANGSPVDATNLSISPEGVVVTVQVTQQLDTKTVPIQAVTVGVPRAGFRVDALNVSPSTVTLVGDPNALKQVQAVATQPIDVTDASSDRTVQAALALPSAVAPLQSQQEYSVTVQVSAIPGTETLLIAPTLANRDAKVAYQIVPGGVSVTVSGPAPDLARLQATDIPVVANVQGITSGTHQVDVIVGVPPNLKLVSAQPASVAVSATTAPQVIPAAVTPTPPPPSPTAASG
jgi:YbbR domain-containing protein